MSHIGRYGDKYVEEFALVNGGAQTQAIPDMEDPAAIGAAWGGFAGVDWAGGDFVTNVAGLNGQAITVLSASPLTTGESFVVNTNQAVLQPCAMEFAGSFVRTGISFATASLFANDPATGPDTVPAPINIVSYYQSSAVLGATNTTTAGTVMHMLLETALPAVGSNQGVYIGDWVNITGLVDTRFNYPNACINYISPDRKTIAVGFSDEVALPSLVSPASGVTTPALGTAKCNFYNNMSGARNGFGLRFTGTVATSAAVVSIFGGDDNQVSGTLLGDHRATISSSTPLYAAGANWGQYEIRANSRYMLECSLGASVILDKPEQTQAQWTARDIPRTSVKPASGALLYPRFRLYKPISMTRPVAKVVSAVHAAASTTTVVTMDVAPSVAGLVVGNYVTLRGVRDQTNFANSATGVAITAIDEGNKQITIAWGAAAIATSYGGSVIEQFGSRDQPGIITGAIQSVQSRLAADANWLDVIGSVAWTGVNPGDYINMHGVRDATTGADLGLDGAWEVAHISTTTMVLKPVFNISGARVSPALGTLGLTNCGGAVILRPTLRAHDLSVTAWGETKITIDGQGTVRSDKTLPVVLPGTSTIAGTVTANTVETTLVTGSNYLLNTAATTNAAVVKATAGTAFFGHVTNTSAAAIHVKVFNLAVAPTVGTSVPLVTFTVAANSTLNLDFGRIGKRFSSGIAICTTAGQATADVAAIAAGCLISIDYV
jgi:hypothetical protein